MENKNLILSLKSLHYLLSYLDGFLLTTKHVNYFKDECLEKFSNKEQVVYRTLRKKLNKVSSVNSITTLSKKIISCSEFELASVIAACSVVTSPYEPFDSDVFPHLTVLTLKTTPILTFTQLLENVKFAYNTGRLFSPDKNHILYRTLKEQEVLCLPDNVEVLDINSSYTKTAAYRLCRIYDQVYSSKFPSVSLNG